MTFAEVWSHRILTASNALSLARIALVAPLWWLVATGAGVSWGNGWLLLTLFVMAASDFLDGFLARRRNEVTPLGRYLDPVADKIAAFAALFLLVRYRDFPLWLAIVVIARDVIGVVLVSVLLFKRRIMGRPNLWGKVGLGLLGLCGLFYFMGWPGRALFVWPVAVVYAAGIMAYWRTYHRALLGRG